MNVEPSIVQSPTAGTSRGDASASNKDPGWYSVGTNPNEQSYWDGRQWSGARHWVAGTGWMEGSGASGGPVTPRLNANPYAQAAVAAPTRPGRAAAPTTFSL